jgi:hypothetical protein
MKMTMHIDEELLAAVMKEYELETKTEAVHFALSELDRKRRLNEFVKEGGLQMTPEELKGMFFDDYDPIALRDMEKPYGHEKKDTD